jgi:hypothetical protein
MRRSPSNAHDHELDNLVSSSSDDDDGEVEEDIDPQDPETIGIMDRVLANLDFDSDE